jgi:hypothetical protein
MAEPKLVARKTAEETLYTLYASLYFPQKNALMTPNLTEVQRKFLDKLTAFLDTASDPEFTNIVASLDNEGFLMYYDRVAELVKFFAPALFDSYQSQRPVEFSRLDGAIQETKDANLAADIIEGFSVPEISRLPFASKMKAMNTLMDTWFTGQNREREMVKILGAVTSDERPAFLSAMVVGENAMLKKICDKTDGAENASVFIFFDNLLTQMGYTVRDKNGVAIPKDRTISARFYKSGVALTSYFDNGRKDQEIAVAAFTPVTFYYQKEKITVPAFTFTDNNAFKDFVFENKYLETLDWSKLSEKQKDDYYFEFVMHYLPGGFLEQLGSPLQLIVGAIIGIFVAGLLAPLKAVLLALDIGSIAYDSYQGVMLIIEATETRKKATSIRELKDSAHLMAAGVTNLTMQVVNAILTFAAASKSKGINDGPESTTTKNKSREQISEPITNVIKPKRAQPTTTRLSITDTTGNSRSCLSKVEAIVTKENIGGGTDTNDSSRAFARLLGKPTDDAGHGLGKLLGGGGGKDYVFPQDPHYNRGLFQKYEGKVADKISVLGQVEVKIDFVYGDPLYPARPTDIIYEVFDTDGNIIMFDTFPNP